jgi:exodeoxyribonuclease V alpha subunit
MLDQDTARCVLQVADETGARVLLVGDRHQLPAVGRGGGLDLAIRHAPDRVTELDIVRRFADPAYADL